MTDDLPKPDPVPSDQVPGLFAPHGALDGWTLNVDDAHDSDGVPWLVAPQPPRRVIAVRRFRAVLARRRANRTRRI